MHNVETMFSANGITPWHGLGEIIQEAPTSHDALTLAGLDWKVNKLPLAAKLADGSALDVDSFYANVRSADNKVLGVVGSKYQIVQNEDAFAFTDNLINNDMGIEVKYETAGSLAGGQRVWLLAKLPMQTILGDDIVPYVVFVNNHDGKGAVRVAMTPTRVVCQNTLNLAMKTATRTWSTTHAGNLEAKMEDARNTLMLATEYMASMEAEAERLQQIAVSNQLFEEMLANLFPYNPFARGDRKNKNNSEARELISQIYFGKADLKKFVGTAWGVYNAVADYTSHLEPLKKVRSFDRFRERRFAGFIDGNNELSATETLLNQIA